MSWSDELYRILGVEVQSFPVTIDKFMQYIDPNNKQMVRKKLDQMLQDQEPLLNHLRIVRPDGQIRILHVRGNVIGSESQEPVRIWGTAQDVTESFMAKKALQKSAAKLSASNRELQEFAYIASHDLQEPLSNSAVSSLMILIGAVGAGVLSDILGVRIVFNLAAILSLVSALLALSLLGPNQIVPEPATYPANN